MNANKFLLIKTHLFSHTVNQTTNLLTAMSMKKSSLLTVVKTSKITQFPFRTKVSNLSGWPCMEMECLKSTIKCSCLMIIKLSMMSNYWVLNFSNANLFFPTQPLIPNCLNFCQSPIRQKLLSLGIVTINFTFSQPKSLSPNFKNYCLLKYPYKTFNKIMKKSS